LTWFEWITRKSASFEHLQAGDGQAFAAFVCLARLFAPVLPLRASAGIQKDGHQEQVDQTAASFLMIDSGRPSSH